MQPDSVSRRILVVARGQDPIGEGRQLELAVLGLLAAGYDTWLATTTSRGSVAARVARQGAQVRQVGNRPRPDAAAVARLIGLARELAPATVLGWGRSQALPAAVAAAGSGARLVSHVGTTPRGLSTGWALRRAGRVIAASAAVAVGCERLGVASRRIATVPPGADAAEAAGLSREAVSARLGLDPEKLWTLCVAPLGAESRLERLLWAIDQLGVVHRRLEHVLVGAGPWRQRILRRARVQRLAERLHLYSHLDCLPDLLRHTRLVWQSGEVACGGAILDGMALGSPAVAVQGDAARQLIVDGVTGRIVPAEPESEFPRRTLALLEDDRLAEGYATAAAARAREEFPADRMVAGVLAAVED